MDVGSLHGICDCGSVHGAVCKQEISTKQRKKEEHQLKGNGIVKVTLAVTFATVFVMSMCINNLWQRNNYTRLYYWGAYATLNSFTDETYGRYGEEALKKAWLVVWPEASKVDLKTEMIEEALDEFDADNKYKEEVKVISRQELLSELEKGTIEEQEILEFDVNEREFNNVTDLVDALSEVK